MRQWWQRSTRRARICVAALTVVAVAGTITFGVVFASGSLPSPPVPTITSGPASPTSSTSATFTFKDTGALPDPDRNHDTDAVTFKCSVDGSSYDSCTTPKTYTGLQDRSHTFQVTAAQEQTSQSAPATFTWVVSTHPPTIVLGFPTNSHTYSATGWNAGCSTPGYCGSASDPAGVTQVQLSIQQVSTSKYWSGSSFSNASQTFATASLSPPGGTSTHWGYAFTAATFPTDGKYTVAVRATDSLGHQTPSSSYVKATFTIDRTPPPTPTITSKPANPTTSTKASFTYKDAEGDVAFQCSLDSGPLQACPGGKSYSGLASGPHQFSVIACDGVGNCSAPAVYNWTISTNSTPFGISGNAVGTFYPGAAGLSINLIIANPFSSTLTVTNATVTVTGTSAGGCSASNFTVIQNLVGTVNIPANTTESLSAAGDPSTNWPSVQMIDTHVNQDACKGATVNFSYSGSGTHN
jgi:hypothetical protein